MRLGGYVGGILGAVILTLQYFKFSGPWDYLALPIELFAFLIAAILFPGGSGTGGFGATVPGTASFGELFAYFLSLIGFIMVGMAVGGLRNLLSKKDRPGDLPNKG